MEELKVTPKEIHELAISKGWYEPAKSIPEAICLMHSELSEGLEAFRNHIEEAGPGSGCLSEEMADTVIRIMDMCEYLGLDLFKAINEKHEYNKGRTYRHGNKAI